MPGLEEGKSALESLNWSLDGIPPTLSPILLAFQNVLRGYRRFPTAESLTRIAALQRVIDTLAGREKVVDIFVGGSLAAGQSTEKSDIDVFGVAIGTPGLNEGGITTDLKQGIKQELEAPALSDHLIHFFDLANLSDYLASGHYIHDLKYPQPLPFGTSHQVKDFYRYHYTSLGIGYCRMELVSKIEELQVQEPLVVKTLRRGEGFPSFPKYYETSFAKWRERLTQNPDFSSQTEAERTQYLQDLEDKERQFLFYLHFPKFSV